MATNSGVFELSEDPFSAAASAKLYPAKVVDLTLVARDTVLLRLLTPRDQTLVYAGGQYASIILGSGLARNYSIAAVNPTTRIADFYIKLVPGGEFSNWLRTQASAGDMVRIRAPYGAFLFKRQPAANTLFVATGTGIVPIFAMLRALEPADKADSGRLHLIWGNRVRAEVFMDTELEVMCASLGIELTTVFSRETKVPSRRVTDIAGAMDLANAAIYAAGNPDMVRHIQMLCQAKGVDPRLVHLDSFTFDRTLVGEEA